MYGKKLFIIYNAIYPTNKPATITTRLFMFGDDLINKLQTTITTISDTPYSKLKLIFDDEDESIYYINIKDFYLIKL